MAAISQDRRKSRADYQELTGPDLWALIDAKNGAISAHFSRSDSTVKMDTEVADRRPLKESGNRAAWVGGRSTMISPGHPEMAAHLSEINGARFLAPIAASDTKIRARY